jgi:dTDP-4-dehydrorhamnose reductase
MLGRRVADTLGQRGIVQHLTDIELDIADRSAVMDVMQSFGPTLVVNCAAYTAVDRAEAEEAQATRVNGDGPRCLAEACLCHQASFVHFSTDYVFDGIDQGPYREERPTAPQNAYGRSKLAGELGIREVFANCSPEDPCRFYVIRTSWLFGHGSSSFVATMWRLMQEREELRVVADQRGRPTFVDDLARAALQLAGCGTESARAPSGLWHFANQGETSWFDLASATRETLERCGAPLRVKRIVPVSTSEFPRPASRPAYSVLCTDKIEGWGIGPRSWRESLAEFLGSAMNSKRGIP